jgi:hypothetical protein
MIKLTIVAFLVLLFNGCGREIALIQNKKDLIKYVKPNKEIILLSQGCANTKSESVRLAKHNFSILIISNIKSKFVKETISNNKNYNKKISYKLTETTSYNNIIGAKYYHEPLFTKQNKTIYCTDIYYDFDYFTSFEDYFNRQIKMMKVAIDDITIYNYLEQRNTYNNLKKDLIFYISFYKNWAKKYSYNSKISLFVLEDLDKQLTKKIDKIKEEILENSILKVKLYKEEFINILSDNKVISNQNIKKAIIIKLLNIKEKALKIIVPIKQHCKDEYTYFNKYTKTKLYNSILVKPICKFHFDKKVFLQNKEYKLLNDSYDIDNKVIKSVLYIDDNLKVTNRTYGYDFISKDYGYKSFKLKIKSSNGLETICSKRIKIKEYDIRLLKFYKYMLFERFEEYVNNKFDGIKKEYPDTFVSSLLDSRNAYLFYKYYALFVHDRLECLVNKTQFDKSKLSCKYYKNRIILY